MTNSIATSTSIYQVPLPDGFEKEPPSCMQKFGSCLMNSVFSLAENCFDKERFKERTKTHLFKNDPAFTHCLIRTPDDVILDGAIRKGKRNFTVLFVVGLGDRFESIADKKSLLYSLAETVKKIYGDITIMAFNVRGRGESGNCFDFTPKRFDIDIYSAYQYLIKQHGFQPEEILPWGISLGGCSVIRGAARIQKEYPNSKISVITDRSFLQIKSVIAGLFGIGRLGKCFQSMAVQCGWDIDCSEDAKSLNGCIIAIVAIADRVITYKASFEQSVDKKSLSNLKTVTIPENTKSEEDPHEAYFSEETVKELAGYLKEIFPDEPSI
ncbi:MAG: hypothetical protein JWO53_1367, partial [Chlamydiia bacterium]|nr:hypothetical protein [Chlamydiia bacterium]